jgi:hypothetical protein
MTSDKISAAMARGAIVAFYAVAAFLQFVALVTSKPMKNASGMSVYSIEYIFRIFLVLVRYFVCTSFTKRVPKVKGFWQL